MSTAAILNPPGVSSLNIEPLLEKSRENIQQVYTSPELDFSQTDSAGWYISGKPWMH